MSAKPFDLIVYGATGFTGRLVAEYLQATYGTGGPVRWAIAGRSQARLAQVRESIGADDSLPLLVADAASATDLADLSHQARVIATTVGPYQLYGEPLLRACAQGGTDYVDLCGEPAWMARMIPQYTETARTTGARITFSCGFDSLPFDLGVVYLQHEAQRRLGAPLTSVRGRVRVMKGGPSGGTIASLLATVEAMQRDPQAARLMADPFALVPGLKGAAAQPDGDTAAYDADLKSWTGPFVMAPINTKNVHRTHALLGHPWGLGFTYDERMLTGDGDPGERIARGLVKQNRIQNALLGFGPTRALLRRFALPKPGEGPSREQRERGRYEIVFSGETTDRRQLRAVVKGDRDPGYGSTCKLMAETALCLASDIPRTRTPGGVWTAGAAMGMTLVQRLHARAGLSFAIEE